jgi:hypothetical protein
MRNNKKVFSNNSMKKQNHKTGSKLFKEFKTPEELKDHIGKLEMMKMTRSLRQMKSKRQFEYHEK